MRSLWESGANRDESGFSIIEVMVAFTILVLVIFAIEYGVVQTISAGVVATQTATEASLASQAIVQAEALPFADLQAGADPTQLTAALNGGGTALTNWPQVVLSGGTYALTLDPSRSNPVTVGTVLDRNTVASTQAPPVVPFFATHTLGNVTYDVAVFATAVTGSPNLVRVTAIVERVLPSTSTSTSAPCPSTAASANATTTMCGGLAQQVVLGAK